MTLLDDFKEISSLCVVQSGQPYVIQEQQVCFGKFLHKASIAAIGPGQSDLVEELREAEIKGLKPFATGLLCERTGKEGFADSGGTTDKKVLVLSDPVTGEES